MDVKKIEQLFCKYIEQSQDQMVIEVDMRKNFPYTMHKHSFNNIKNSLIERNIIERFDAMVERYGHQRLVLKKCLRLKDKTKTSSMNEDKNDFMLNESSKSLSGTSEEKPEHYISPQSQLLYEVPLFYQIYQAIENAGRNGITQNELQALFPVSGKILYFGLSNYLSKKLDVISSILVRDNKVNAYHYYSKDNFPHTDKKESSSKNGEFSSETKKVKRPAILTHKRNEFLISLLEKQQFIQLVQARHLLEKEEGKQIDHTTFFRVAKELEKQNKLKIVTVR